MIKTFEELLNYTIENHYANKEGRAYESVKLLLKPLFRKNFRKIYYDDIENLKKDLKNKGLKNSTIKSALSMISVCYNQALKAKKHIVGTKPIVKPYIERFLGQDDKRDSISMEKNDRDYYKKYALDKGNRDFYNFIIIAFGTMLRINEVLSIKKEHVNFQTNIITIHKTKNHKKHKVIMNNSVRKAIDEMLPKMFENYTYNMVYWWFLCAENSRGEGKHITPHSLRHAGATALKRKHVPNYVIKDAGNWSSEEIIENYTHTIDEELQNAYNLLDDAI